MNVTAINGTYVWHGAISDKHHAKAAGFEWSIANQRWETGRHDAAAQLRHCFDEQAAHLAARSEASRAVDAPITVPAPAGKSYLGYQRAGVSFLLANENALLADEMGLGKTIQAIGLINACPDVISVIIVCPATLKANWRRELAAWLTVPMTVAVVGASAKVLPRANILIVNYDILQRHQWPEVDLLILDEAHYIKSPLARRTKKALAIRARRKIFLTGTPIESRPIDIYNLIHALDPRTWPSRAAFGMRYCAGFWGPNGADYRGSSNLAELHDKLRSSVMLRRLKRDVLAELPAKRRQVVELPVDAKARTALVKEGKLRETIATALKIRAGLDESLPEYGAQVGQLTRYSQDAFESLALVRHETALAKADQCIEFIKDVLETEAKVVVFAWHRDVIEKIAAGLGSYGPVTLTGDTPMDQREASVTRFQADPECRVFIGNIKAAGVGITLTAASQVICVELDWVPGVMTQAEDRCHRLGQKDAVLVQHLVLEGSLDAHMAKVLVKKQDILDQALDGARPAGKPHKFPRPAEWLDAFSESETTPDTGNERTE